MRIVAAILALTVCVSVPQVSSAEGLLSGHLANTASGPVANNRLPGLLQKLGLNLIGKAQAAECTAEGETCTSNEQCCSGLECTGGPPATCTAED
jgi:hypothetical protein